MGHNDFVAGLVAEFGGDIRPDHGVEEIAEGRSRSEFERPAMPVMVELEVVGRGPHHAKAVVAVAERNRNDPGDVGARRDVLVGLPGNVVGRVADAEDGIEKQVEASAARAHDEVGSGDRVGETLPRSGAHFFDAEKQHHAQSYGEDREERRQPAVGERLQREADNDQGWPPSPPPLSRRSSPWRVATQRSVSASGCAWESGQVATVASVRHASRLAGEGQDEGELTQLSFHPRPGRLGDVGQIDDARETARTGFRHG